jgi:non-ribosomal peptide synthetase component F
MSDHDFRHPQVGDDSFPDIIDSTVHELVAQRAAEQPDAVAVASWDRDFTYAELDEAANRLAHHLVKSHGVRLEDVVHVCFDKSAWYFVAILAVNKAGACWSPIDPGHPLQRSRTIVAQTRARLALSSPENARLCGELVDSVVEVTPRLDAQLWGDEEASRRPPETGVGPRNAVYILFTSGSTGTPKGFVMEHGSVCTSQIAIGKRLGLSADVRLLQFATFIFDLSIGEIIGPLIFGASIHVPSEAQRLNNLAEFVRDQSINWTYFTPSFTRTLRPEDYPGVELVLLAGEAVGQDVLETWVGKVRLWNGWGPAETCVFSTLHELLYTVTGGPLVTSVDLLRALLTYADRQRARASTT